MKQIKFLATFFAMMLTLGFTSCSSDDNGGPDTSGFKDYFVEVDVKGDKLSSSEVNYIESFLDNMIYEMGYKYMDGFKYDDALELFNDLIDAIDYVLREDFETLDGEVTVVFNLYLDETDELVSTRTIKF